jgi:phage gp29-like protein
MNGILFGMSAVRLTWENDKIYGTRVSKAKHLELTELDFSYDDSNSLDQITTSTLSGNFTRKPLDNDVHLFVRYNPLQGILDDYPGSIMRTNMIYVLLKYLDYINWASANEKYSDPLRFAQYKKGASKEEIATIMSGLDKLGQDSYAAFSDDVKVEFLEALRSGIVNMHQEFVSAVNTEMSISVLGQTLTTDVNKIGSFAAAKVHNFVRQDILWGDIILFQNILSEQYIQKDFIENFGEPKNAFPIFRFKTDEVQDYESNTRVIAELRDAGIALRKEEVYLKSGFTVPKEGDEII